MMFDFEICDKYIKKSTRKNTSHKNNFSNVGENLVCAKASSVLRIAVHKSSESTPGRLNRVPSPSLLPKPECQSQGE